MMRRNRQRRVGFTLIELLVVISIIAVLMGLLISGVMKVLSTSPRTETIARMKGLDAAIGTFKSDRFGGKGYIPAGRHDPTTGLVVGQFRLRNSYPVTPTAGQPGLYDFEAQYLIQAFSLRPDPTTGLANLGNAQMNADLDANQTLLFFLGGVPLWDGAGNVAFTGFSNNPVAPFSPAAAGDSRKGPYLDITRKMYSLDSAAAGTFPRLIDGYGGPFAYFTSFNGKAGIYGGWNQYPAPFGTAQYYVNGTGTGAQPVNATGWQIISAGRDQVFFGSTNNWSALDGPSIDNLANFSTKILGAGPVVQ